MKINGINRPQVDAAVSVRPAPVRGATSSATRVAVSGEARQLADARAPEFADAAKVQRLIAAVARGDLMVSASSVVDRMLTEER